MKKVLFTGGSGFVGRNILPALCQQFDVFAPSRKELDLRDPRAVRAYLEKGQFDAVVHSANPNPVKSADFDSADKMFEDSLRCFMHFYNCRDLCGKLLYLGSGAEFDKTMDMNCVREEEVHRSFPPDIYGCTKFIMNELASRTENVYNLRLFACYGPYDHESKFITHVIRSCLDGVDITIRQECLFDYLHVYDLGKVIAWAIDAPLHCHDYNIASGVQASLSQIAQEVRRQMDAPVEVTLLRDGWNKAYTADISRLKAETDLWKQFISLEEGIRMQIEHEKTFYHPNV